MAGLLEPLEPLADLVGAATDPAATCGGMIAAVEKGSPEALIGILGKPDLAVSALRRAGITGKDGRLTASARDELLRLEAMVALRAAGTDRWEPMMTVPPYLRKALPEGKVSETFSVLLDLVSAARRRVIMASPFLDEGFENLIPAVARFADIGGEFLLITRELARPDSRNSSAVRVLRKRCLAGSKVDVVSWEEEGLGLHMKAVVVDSIRAYVGSANITWGGLEHQAELGVRLEGPSVREIERLLDVLADELRGRRRFQAR